MPAVATSQGLSGLHVRVTELGVECSFRLGCFLKASRGLGSMVLCEAPDASTVSPLSLSRNPKP